MIPYISLFSGIAGFELGIGHRATCIGFSEIDKYAVQVYKSHFQDHYNYGDITKINAEDLPSIELIVGGFPCQAFSIAGLRRGFDDTRGTLFFDIARIIRAKQPRLVLLENVKGLLSHDGGRTFGTIIAALDELGYDVQWQVLNSKDFGVPQNRERVFIVGNLRGTPRPEVFPLSGTSNEAPRVSGIAQLNNPTHSNNRVYGAHGLSPSLNTMQGGNRQPKILQRARGKNDGGVKALAPTMSANDYPNNNLVNGIRRLTPLECERLQGFPDGWTDILSDSRRYKCLGNAVTVNVIRAIAEKLLP